MEDRHAVVLALCAFFGAWVTVGAAPWLGAAGVALALVARRPLLLCAATAVLAGTLATQARAGLVPPPTGAFSGTATLLSDPAPAGTRLRADATVGAKHVQLVASGDAAKALTERLAGEVLDVRGTMRHLSPGERWLEQRHIVATLAVDSVVAWRAGSPVARMANAVHRALARGAEVFPPAQRPLFLGIVLGDDRDQRPEVTDDFRGAGLSHLLAVSGQNVAFVLALAGPVLRRLGIRGRLVATLAVIVCFALLTRFEPSVLRASAMAGIAALAVAWGREASGVRALALAVTVLVLADPFLVASVGFQLSVAASIGILVIAPRLVAVIPGPRALAEGLSVTLAAQAAVSPLLVTTFGGVPIAAVPANLLAVPAAGPVMMWGLGAGIPAGMLGGAWASVLHLPTRVLVGWIAGVARWAASLPLGELRGGELAALAIAVAALLLAHRLDVRWPRLPATALIASALVLPGISLWAAPPATFSPAAGITVWTAGSSVAAVVDGRADAEDVLEAMRRSALRRVDVLVLASSSARGRAAGDAIVRRYGPSLVLAVSGATGDEVDGRVLVTEPTEVRVGPIRLLVAPHGTTLQVTQVGASARGPPV